MHTLSLSVLLSPPRSYMRNAKVYRLENKTGDSHDTVVRVRSIPRSQANELGVEHFCQDPLTNRATCRGMSMRATLAMQIVHVREGRSLPKSLNLRRKQEVNVILLSTLSLSL